MPNWDVGLGTFSWWALLEFPFIWRPGIELKRAGRCSVLFTLVSPSAVGSSVPEDDSGRA